LLLNSTLCNLFYRKEKKIYIIIIKKKNSRNKNKGLQMQGFVKQCLSNGMFLIQLENGFQTIAYISGKIRRNSIRILLGDEVIVEVSPYDLSRGRILYRLSIRKKKK